MDVPSTRRDFLRTSTLAAAGTLSLSSRVFAAGDDVIRIGLIGCGGRGTGAAAQALQADQNVKLVAMGDVFEDRLKLSLESLSAQKVVADKIDVPPERRFIGFDAYEKVLDSGVDVVLLTTPPHFRPAHLRAAIEAGKHVFAEKPVAVDAPGVRSVLETCDIARAKNLSVVSGLCLRYDQGFRDTVARIHDGELGELRTLQANDFRGKIWVKPRQPAWTDMHWQMRNWYYLTWLSGDFNVEQHVHYLDVCAWIKGEYPETAVGMGGRLVRSGPEYGNIFDHHSVIYEFADGCKFFSNTRQMPNCWNSMAAYVAGSKGTAEVSERRLVFHSPLDWKYTGKHEFMYQQEHNELFAGIRSGNVLNNGEYMAKSTLLAIMGRMATYTGKQITWEQAMNSQESLGPKTYEWGEIETPPVAHPGVTKVV